ncbi:hypothetical protein QYN14_25585 [Rhodococcus ruber]|uniref:hypothetical protein n=1 Tax=Rhodococcus ruber TaxID=1830 RepID=UPI00265A07AC|nr:hypothetical protein [Rhodococcus ruber]WKK11921.1 hypothetical protein QYN14_25165 [Rhodococcus ruber]WKK12005.1 hypothetical protein QYN14_25585 [Rhodococcus ruber]
MTSRPSSSYVNSSVDVGRIAVTDCVAELGIYAVHLGAYASVHLTPADAETLLAQLVGAGVTVPTATEAAA